MGKEKKGKSRGKENTDRFIFDRYYPDLSEKLLHSPYRLEEWEALNFLTTSKYYKDKFLEGDEEAIYSFVKNYDSCFREVWPFPDGSTETCYSKNNIFQGDSGRSWVIEQMEKWKAEGTSEAREKLRKLIAVYTDPRGREPQSPEIDETIYREIKKKIAKGKRKGDAILDIAEKFINFQYPTVSAVGFPLNPPFEKGG